ncbi:MAG: glycoside hydrolase family 99-like domain-containing protein [Gemmatales bacterium]|nr:glycoside hydrolase family 99-like domain-containing protein [Gemmatales bacterium]MDW7994634.1 glycoside hydrolase family 99-like domain-containing protein [Gemmatales bacterium]
MHRTNPWSLITVFAGIGCISITSQQPLESLEEPSAAVSSKKPRLVLAFYYGWYGTPQHTGKWVHWQGVNALDKRIENSTHYPILGAYDSHDPHVVAQHCKDAKNVGIDGFIATWWRPRDFHDRGLPLLLNTAHKHGLAVTVYIETVPDQTVEQAVQDALYILSQYSDHPAWLRVDSKPVLFVYARAIEQLGLDNWRRVIAIVAQKRKSAVLWIGDRMSPEAVRIFDGIHTYNITEQTAGKDPEQIRLWARQQFPRWVRLSPPEKISCLTVIPGYDDSKLKERKPPRPITSRHQGDTYRILWEEAIAANPDWILITSWNEWHEGTEIEPSVEHGNRELQTTKIYSARFKKGEPTP